MNCRACRKNIYEFHERALDGALAVDVQDHLQSCRDCSRFFAQQADLGRLLQLDFSAWTKDLHFIPGPFGPGMKVARKNPVQSVLYRLVPASVLAVMVLAIAVLLLLVQPWTVGRQSQESRLYAEMQRQSALLAEPAAAAGAMVMVIMDRQGGTLQTTVIRSTIEAAGKDVI